MTTFEKLLQRARETKDIKMIEHPTLPFVQFCYTRECQEERKWDDVTLNARGHIYEKSSGWRIASPMPKFFNYTEEEAESLLEDNELSFEDFERVNKKEDGTMVFSYIGEDGISWATKGSLQSEYTEEASRVWQKVLENAPLPAILEKLSYITLVMELITPKTKVVIDYGGEEKMVLISALSIEDGVEIPYKEQIEIANALGIEIAEEAYPSNFSELVEWSKTNQEIEGWVVTYPNGLKVKVKTRRYFEHHRAASYLTEKRIRRFWQEERITELRRGVPEEYWGRIDEVILELDRKAQRVLEKAQDIYNDIPKGKEVEFILREEKEFQPILFAMKAGKSAKRAVKRLVATT